MAYNWAKQKVGNLRVPFARKKAAREGYEELKELEKALEVISNAKIKLAQRIDMCIEHLLAAKVHEERLKAILEWAKDDEGSRFLIGMLLMGAQDSAERPKVNIDRYIADLQIAKHNINPMGVLEHAWAIKVTELIHHLQVDIAICETALDREDTNKRQSESKALEEECKRRKAALKEAYERSETEALNKYHEECKKSDEDFLAKREKLEAMKNQGLDSLQEGFDRKSIDFYGWFEKSRAMISALNAAMEQDQAIWHREKLLADIAYSRKSEQLRKKYDEDFNAIVTWYHQLFDQLYPPVQFRRGIGTKVTNSLRGIKRRLKR